MANFIDQLNIQLQKLQEQIKKLINDISAWPQYRKISAGMMLFGFLLFIIGIVLY